MTNNEKAQKEWETVRQWVLAEEDKVMNKLKKSGIELKGLDANHEAFAYIYKERNRRLEEIKEKYGIK